jgi:hypothetical protein
MDSLTVTANAVADQVNNVMQAREGLVGSVSATKAALEDKPRDAVVNQPIHSSVKEEPDTHVYNRHGEIDSNVELHKGKRLNTKA